MSWIKARTNLRSDPKVVACARHMRNANSNESVLRLPLRDVTRVTVCCLLDVWGSLNTTLTGDGISPFMVLSDLDEIAEMPGIGAAMESVGWVVELPEGGLQFPNFEEHNSPEKGRSPLSNAERQKRHRDRKKAKDSTPKPDRNESNESNGEKRREEKNKEVSKDTSRVIEPKDDQARFSPYVETWNRIAGAAGLAPIRKLTPGRIKAIKAREKSDAEFLDSFTEALANMVTYPHYIGHNGRGWKADFDFMFQPRKDRILQFQEAGEANATKPEINGQKALHAAVSEYGF